MQPSHVETLSRKYAILLVRSAWCFIPSKYSYQVNYLTIKYATKPDLVQQQVDFLSAIGKLIAAKFHSTADESLTLYNYFCRAKCQINYHIDPRRGKPKHYAKKAFTIWNPSLLLLLILL